MSNSGPEAREKALSNWGDSIAETPVKVVHRDGKEIVLDPEHGDRELHRAGTDYWTEDVNDDEGKKTGERRAARRFEVTTRYHGDQKVLPPEVLGALAPYASREHEVEYKSYTPLDAKGEPQAELETKPIEKEFVREHPLTQETANLDVFGEKFNLEGTLTTLGFTVKNPEANPADADPQAPRVKDAHGQLISVDIEKLRSVREAFDAALNDGGGAIKKYDKGAERYCLQLKGADGEFGEDSFSANGRNVDVKYRQLSLDCEPNGTPKKLTIHFRWDGDTETPPM